MNHQQANKLLSDLDRVSGAAHWISPTLLDELPLKHVRVIQDANMSFVRAIEEMRANIKVMAAESEADQRAGAVQADIARQGQVDPHRDPSTHPFDPNAPANDPSGVADQRDATPVGGARAVDEKESQRKGFGESKSADSGASDATKKPNLGDVNKK